MNRSAIDHDESSPREFKYPRFRDPSNYLRKRASWFPMGIIKSWIERRSLNFCLNGLNDVQLICDVPSGPGRLFPYWKSRGYRVNAVELSQPMILAARRSMGDVGLTGTVLAGNAFELMLPEPPDLIACVRFLYYFDSSTRVQLLQGFAQTTRRYVLLQYKIATTCKGRRNYHRKRGKMLSKSNQAWHFATRSQIRHEIKAADLRLLSLRYMGRFSDRVYVLAEKLKGALDSARETSKPGFLVWLLFTYASLI